MSTKFIFNELDKTKLINRADEVDQQNILNHYLIKQALKSSFAETTNEMHDTTIEMLETDEDDNAGDAQLLNDLNSAADSELPTTTIVAITSEDLEQAKCEAYQAGYDQATKACEIDIYNIKEQLRAINQLNIDLDKLNYDYSTYEQGVTTTSLNIIMKLLHKLNKILPTNFADILTQQLAQLLNNNRLEAQLTVNYHPNQQAIFDNIFNNIKLSDESKKHLVFEMDAGLSINTCKVNYKEASLEFDEAQVMVKIEELIRNNNFNITD